MKKLIKFLFLTPTLITPLTLVSCSTKKEIISSKKETINRDRYIGEIKANIDFLIDKIQKRKKNKNNTKNDEIIDEIISKIFDYFYYYSKPKTTNLTNYIDILKQLYKEINNKNDSELIEINIKLNNILKTLN